MGGGRRIEKTGRAKARVWTETQVQHGGLGTDYDLAPDGKRLAAVVVEEGEGEKLPTHLTFLLNFFDELRRKVPDRN